MQPDPDNDLPAFAAKPSADAVPYPEIDLPPAARKPAARDAIHGSRPRPTRRPGLDDTTPMSLLVTPTEPGLAAAADVNLANDLIQLLSQLEYARVQVAQLNGQSCPPAALGTFAAMLTQVTTVTERHFADDMPPELRTVSSDLAEAIQALQSKLAQSVLTRFLNVFRSAAPGASKRSRAFRQTAGRVLGVLEAYFKLFTERLCSPAAAKEWEQTSSLFLVELRRDVDNLTS